MSYPRKVVMPDFEKRGGLITVVVVAIYPPASLVESRKIREILMVASANETAYRLTLETGLAHFWSRSRGKLWKKGESSGNVIPVCEIQLDCDRDAVIYYSPHKFDSAPACHTGKDSCFFRNALYREDFDRMLGDPKVEYKVAEAFVKQGG